MIIKAPEKRPAAPEPATALPMMSIVELTAKAHIKLPTSNVAMKEMYVHLREKY
jgi:hypothetical protein